MLYSLLRCPACDTAGLDRSSRVVICPSCGRRYDAHGDFVDMLEPGFEPTAHSAEQRLMESPLVANLYERIWRPTFVRLVAGRGAAGATGGFAGEFFIIKNSLAMEDRDGPWLDLSCGPGTFTRAMAASAPGHTVVGLDISRAMLEVASQRAKGYSNVGLVRADAHALPFASESFGGINNSGALHAYNDPETVFHEVLRVLRPGGVYVGSTFSMSGSLLGRVTSHAAGIRRFDPLELRAWLSRIGLVDYDEIDFGGSLIFRVRRP